jgi:hypothetical protein
VRWPARPAELRAGLDFFVSFCIKAKRKMLLFAFKNKKDNSVLNIEFYGKLIDIGKALPTEESSFINRNEIGIHIGLPINIPTFK